MNQQKGVSLIITFLMMTLILAMVLALVTMLFSETSIVRNIANSLSAFYAADTGIEKTYYLKKSAGSFCNICTVCTDCTDCTLTPLVIGGCNIQTCNNCELTYRGDFDGRNFMIDATLTPDPLNSTALNLCINSKGFFKNTVRTIDVCPEI